MRLCLVALIWCPAFAHAHGDVIRNGISFDLGLGVMSRPGYLGAEDNALGPTGGFSLDRLEFGRISRDGVPRYGLRFRPSFGVVGPRRADDYTELTGLEDVDFSFEIGGGLIFAAPDYALFAKLRKGISGHEALVAELGGDVVYRATDQVTLSVGPRVLWGDDVFAQTYFGVSAAESAVSDFEVFEAGSGIIRVGVEAKAEYRFGNNWGVTGKINFDQLQDDAADSPISASDTQFKASVLLTRRITLGF